MNTKKSLLTSAPEAENNKAGVSRKIMLRRAIQLALAGSMLASGIASAVLTDHGPVDPTNGFPQWYRDGNGQALGMCLSTSTFCFPLVPDPAGFAGNIGPEAFYNMVEFKGTSTGVGGTVATGTDFEYRYMGALEASYLPGPTPVKGDSSVFARIRITFNFNDTAKEGTYVVTHPFGVHTFPNVKATAKTNLIGSQAANFFTVDVPLGLGFDGALQGPVGPFIKWTGNLPLTNGAEQFVGDPTIPHTITGGKNGINYLRIQGPVGSKLDGTNDFIQVNLANVLGQIWTAPIAQPLKVDEAKVTRTPTINGVTVGVNGIDVWATSSPNQRLVVTGTNMPSLQLRPTGTVAGKYHGHIEYANTSPAGAAPAQLKVTNLSSNPVVSATLPLEDVIKINQADFDTATRQLTVVAHSSDQVVNPGLRVEGISGVPSAFGVVPAVSNAMTRAQCANVVTASATNDLCLVYSLPAAVEPPETVSVLSADGGTHVDRLLDIVGAPQNPANPPVAADFPLPGIDVKTAGISNLTLDANARIIRQPLSGVISLNAGQWIFSPKAGAVAGADSFTYVIKTITPPKVSNLATGNLNVVFEPFPANTQPDQFAAQTGIARTVNVLANDKAASTNPLDALDPATVTIQTQPTTGSVTANADGTVTYSGNSAGVDTFTYTVNTQAGILSQPATVSVTNFTARESVAITRARISAQLGWVITGTTNWFGANLTDLTVTCWNGVGTNPLPEVIGTATIDGLGGFIIQTLPAQASASTPATNIRCQTSSGGEAAGLVQ